MYDIWLVYFQPKFKIIIGGVTFTKSKRTVHPCVELILIRAPVSIGAAAASVPMY